jgi:transposase InsO family protein
VKSKSDSAPKERKDGRKPGSAWPRDVMVAAASAVVDKGVPAYRVGPELGIPYTTVLKWAKAYRAGGRAALEQAPGRGGSKPSGYPQAARAGLSPAGARTPVGNREQGAKVDPRREAVIAAKKAEPQAGSRRIRDVVRRFFGIGTSDTTVRRVLEKEGLAQKRSPVKPRSKPAPRRFERAEPNQLWQSDLFTFLLRKHERIYVAAFLDDHSRYLVSLVMAHHQRSSLVMEALARAIADYGVPREILTDQGRQYTAWRGETGFEVSTAV